MLIAEGIKTHMTVQLGGDPFTCVDGKDFNIYGMLPLCWVLC